MTLTETEFTDEILKWAKVYGWRRFHVRGNTRRLIQGDVGFVDLVMVRPPRLVFAELKVGKGKTTPEQNDWLKALGLCRYDPMEDVASPIEVYVWRPEMWSEIHAVLSSK